MSSSFALGWAAVYDSTCTESAATSCAAVCAGFVICSATPDCCPDPELSNYSRAMVGENSAGVTAPNYRASASASASVGCESGSLSFAWTSTVSSYVFYRPTSPQNCTLLFDGPAVQIDIGVADIEVDLNCSGCNLVTYAPNVAVGFTMSFEQNHSCQAGLGPGGGFEWAGHDVTVRLTGRYSDNSTQTQILQGVFGAKADGVNPASTVKLGMFTSTDFTASSTTSSASLSATSASLSFTLPFDLGGGVHLVGVDPEVEATNFSAWNVDFTPSSSGSDQPCWTDRALLVNAIGSTVGDGTYKAAYDYDLDGDVDVADHVAYKAIFDTLACVADFNCDGAVSIQDLFDFQAACFNDDPVADINASGSVTVEDLFDYLTVYFGGC